METGVEPSESRVADEFVRRLSHDLRAPVRSLSLIAEWIEEDLSAAHHDLPTSVTEYLRMMRVQSARLESLVADLGTLVRIGRDREPLGGTWETLVEQVTARFPGIGAFNIRTELTGRPWGIGAEDARTLMTALLSNAVKHHDRGAGTIEIVCRGGRESLTIAVADDGPGLPSADWDRARSPMVTLRSRDQVDGSGLGLAIADRICALYAGTLSLERSPFPRGCRVVATMTPRVMAGDPR